VLVISLLTSTTLHANTFRDVPANHFAHEAITWVSSPANGSFMVGDAGNNFNPARVMDVFEAAVVMAMAAGFKYSPASITPADQALFDLAYANHGALLRELSEQNPRWRSANNREIAFLLERELLSPADLDYFMVQGTGGVEVVASLSKEMATAFVIRLSGNYDSTAEPPTAPFRDEADINPLYSAYAYLGYFMGIVGSYDGHFAPLRHVTRAEFAQMLHHLQIVAPGAPGMTTPTPTPTPASTNPAANPASSPAPTNSPAPSPQPTASPFSHTVHGIVAGVIPNTHIYITANDETHRHAFSTNPHIVIDNVQSTVTDIWAGMEVVAGFDHTNHIISMVARVVPLDNIESSPTPTATPLPTATPEPAATPVPTPIPTTPPAQVIQYLEGAEGIVTGMSPEIGVPTLITIRTARVDMHTGAVLLEEYLYFVTPDTRFIVDGEFVLPTTIQVGDVIFFEQSNSVLYNVYILEPPATGVLSTVEGVLEAIFIDQDVSSLILQLPNNQGRYLYVLPEDVYSAYNLRRGMELRLYLDGREIYGLTQIGGTPAVTEGGASFVAYVRALRQGHTMVVESSQGSRYTLRVDGNTINTATNNVLNFRDLRTNMKLYIVISPEGSVRSVTILP